MSEPATPLMDPHSEYTSRLSQFEETSQRWSQRERLLSRARLAMFGATLVLVWLAFGTATLAAGWPGIAALLFVGLVIAHDRVIQRRRAADRSAGFYRLKRNSVWVVRPHAILLITLVQEFILPIANWLHKGSSLVGSKTAIMD